MVHDSSRSLRQFYSRIRKYLWLFMGIFTANAIFSLLLLIWIVNSGLNERTHAWSMYLTGRINFFSNSLTKGSSSPEGFTTVFKILPDGKVVDHDQDKISLKTIADTDLFKKIDKIDNGSIRIIQFRNTKDPALKAVYLIKKTKQSYTVGLLKISTFLPVVSDNQTLILFDGNGDIQFSTRDDFEHSVKYLKRGLVFKNGQAFAIEHTEISNSGGLHLAVIKDITKEFYGLLFLTFLTTITLGMGLIRSKRISLELQRVESEFIKINSLLSGITTADSSTTVSIIMQDIADDLKRIDWEHIARNTFFEENKKYLQSMAFFAGNVIHLLDAISEHAKALTLSEEKYRELVNRANSLILRIDLEGKITFFNEFARKFFGFSSEEIIGRNIIGTITPEFDSYGLDLRKKMALLYKDPELVPSSNNENMRRDGSRVWVQWTNSPVYNRDGKLVEILCVGMDTTERRQAVLDLKKANNFTKDIIDSMPSTVISVDNELHVNHFNLSAGKMSDLPINEIQNASVTDAFPILSGFREKIESAILTGLPDAGNITTTTNHGRLRYDDIMIYPLTGNEEQGAVIRIDDVTERVRIEEIMIQTEKMMSVGGLAAGMAHEINNPLGGILQGIQNIIRRLSPDLKANREAAEASGCDLEKMLDYMERRKITTMLNGITESGIRAADIVSGMLEFSRQSDSKKAPGRLDTLLDNTISLAAKDYNLKKRYDFKQIEIVRNYDPDVPPVLCSNTEIEQVFLNLLRNSAQAMAAWEEMQEDPRIEVTISKARNMVCCEIKDNGPGMNAYTRKRVFEPFFTTKDPGVGTGLGLSVSYFIITKNHNGIFEVRSKPGEGTSFTIMIPAAY